MSKPTVITITTHAPTAERRLSLEVESDYAEPFIEALKEAIPVRDRWWDPAERRWWVAPEHLETLTRLAREHFDRAWLHDGAARTDLHTGQTHHQLELSL